MTTGKKIAISMTVAVLLFVALNVLAFSHLAIPESIALYPLSVKLVVFLCVFLSVFLLLFLIVNLKTVEENRLQDEAVSYSTATVQRSAPKMSPKPVYSAPPPVLSVPPLVHGHPSLTEADMTLMEEVKKSHQGPAIERMLDSIFQEASCNPVPPPLSLEPCAVEAPNYFFPASTHLFSFRSVPLKYLEKKQKNQETEKIHEFQSLIADVLT